MNKRIMTSILNYLCLSLMFIYSIYKIVDLSIKLSDNYKINYILGICIFSVVIILCIGSFVMLLKSALYRKKFIDKNKK